MFSKWFAKREDGGPPGASGPGPASGDATKRMGSNVQRRFARGVDCNSEFWVLLAERRHHPFGRTLRLQKRTPSGKPHVLYVAGIALLSLAADQIRGGLGFASIHSPPFSFSIEPPPPSPPLLPRPVKMVIRGDRATGKSSLFELLQGKAMSPQYVETPEIQVGDAGAGWCDPCPHPSNPLSSIAQVSNISWKYKNVDDVVKVEVWDVVDKGKPRRHSDASKLRRPGGPHQVGRGGGVINNLCSLTLCPPLCCPLPSRRRTSRLRSMPPLSTSTKVKPGPVQLGWFCFAMPQPLPPPPSLSRAAGTHAVVMMLDVCKPWTFEYVEREIPNVPADIPVLILVCLPALVLSYTLSHSNSAKCLPPMQTKANFRDMESSRKITIEQIEMYTDTRPRGKGAAKIMVAETSLTEGPARTPPPPREKKRSSLLTSLSLQGLVCGSCTVS